MEKSGWKKLLVSCRSHKIFFCHKLKSSWSELTPSNMCVSPRTLLLSYGDSMPRLLRVHGTNALPNPSLVPLLSSLTVDLTNNPAPALLKPAPKLGRPH